MTALNPPFTLLQWLTEGGTRDSLASPLHRLRCRVAGLDYPEILLASSQLPEDPLHVQHPFFEPLHRAIVWLGEAPAELAQEADLLRTSYQLFIDSVCSSSGPKREKLLLGKARLYGLEQVWQLRVEKAQQVTGVSRNAAGFIIEHAAEHGSKEAYALLQQVLCDKLPDESCLVRVVQRSSSHIVRVFRKETVGVKRELDPIRAGFEWLALLQERWDFYKDLIAQGQFTEEDLRPLQLPFSPTLQTLAQLVQNPSQIDPQGLEISDKSPTEMMGKWLSTLPIDREVILDWFTQYFPKNRSVALRTRLSDTTIARSLRNARCLEGISFLHAPNLTCHGIIALWNARPKLHLAIGQCEKISANTLAALVRDCAWRFDGRISLILAGVSHEVVNVRCTLNQLLFDCLVNKAFPFAEAMVLLGANWEFVDAQDRSFLHRTATLETADALEFLLEQGILEIEAGDRRSQTPLHRAAKEGSCACAQALIAKRAAVDARDRDGNYPLHLAAISGNVATFQLLLTSGANPLWINSNNETILHIACANGKWDIVRALPEENLKTLLGMKDEWGKEPLHIAATYDKDGTTVQYFLQLGGDPNAQDQVGDTPVHKAANSGLVAAFKQLQAGGAHLDIPNAKGRLPFDIAVYKGHDAVILAHIDPTLSKQLEFLQTTKEPQRLEELCVEYFRGAHTRGAIAEQIFILVKLSELSRSSGQHLQAAKFANAALFLEERKKPSRPIHRYLLSELERIEADCLNRICGIKVSSKRRNYLEQRREELVVIRQVALDAVASGTDSVEAAASLSESYRKLFAARIEEAVDLLGPAPCKWAAVSYGSLREARMCPYSDIDWGLLIEDEGSRAYFENLALIVAIMMANYGETEMELPGDFFPLSGFSIDSKINPIGVREELLGTPETMASLQEEAKERENTAVSTAVASFARIAGDKGLVKSYERAIKKSTPNRAEKGERLFTGDLKEYCLDVDHLDLTLIGVKKHLLRPFDQFAAILAIQFKIAGETTVARLTELAKFKPTRKRFFSQQQLDHLLQAYSKALKLRFAAHEYYGGDLDGLFFPAHDFSLDEGQELSFIPTREQARMLGEIIQVLIPFSKAMRKFHQDGTFPAEDEGGLFCDEDFNIFDKLPKGRPGKTIAHPGGRRLTLTNFVPSDHPLSDIIMAFHAAKTGLPAEQRKIAEYLMDGRDIKTGIVWLQRAAKAGDPIARNLLGQCYRTGFGVGQSSMNATAQFMSAEEKSPQAKINLGVAYWSGYGVPLRRQETKRRFTEAIDESLFAQLRDTEDPWQLLALGACYELGIGGTIDVDEAKSCYERAQSLPAALLCLGYLLHTEEPERARRLAIMASRSQDLAIVNRREPWLCYEQMRGK